jgi:hypothetical protein
LFKEFLEVLGIIFFLLNQKIIKNAQKQKINGSGVKQVPTSAKNGDMVTWLHGVMVTWLHSDMVAWCYGDMVAW